MTLGADVFVFRKTGDSNPFAADVIGDFSRIEGDRISLRAIDANVLARGNQDFTFIGDAAFSGQAGQARFSGGVLQLDVNGDRVADMAVSVENVAGMVASDFIL